MLNTIKQAFRRAAAFVAAIFFSSASPAVAVETPPSPPEAVQPAEASAPATTAQVKPDQIPQESCLATTLCGVKKQLKWSGGTPWNSGYCRVIARKVLDAAAKHDLPPALLLAVMINESDLNERAVNNSTKTTPAGDTVVYAKDSGLMGIRCILDGKETCTNGAVKGLAWKSLMDPLRNIDLGAGELARWRDGGGITTTTTRVRRPDGSIEEKTKVVPCQHKTHAYWAHYNHGPRYIDKGNPRHYPHRVAVLYHALAETLHVDAPELRNARITINDKGVRPRTADRPVEKRYREICAHIRSAGTTCSGVAAAAN